MNTGSTPRPYHSQMRSVSARESTRTIVPCWPARSSCQNETRRVGRQVRHATAGAWVSRKVSRTWRRSSSNRADDFTSLSKRGRGRPVRMSALMRPGCAAHHQHAVAEIDRLLDAVGDEQHGRLVLRSRFSAVRPAASRGSARRPRRTARPSGESSGPSRRRGRAPCAAACRRKSRAGNASRSPSRPTRSMWVWLMARRLARGTPRISRPNSTLPITVRHGSRP